MSKNKKKGTISIRTMVSLLALVLLLGCAIGGTVAWLTAQTDPVTNTFTVGDINIELAETTGTSYKIVPGHNLAKDPKVTVKANSEKCWLFVKVNISDAMQTAADKGVKWNYAEGWTELEDAVEPHPDYAILYRIVDASAADQSFNVLKGNDTYTNGVVTVPGENLSKAELEAIQAKGGATLTFTAYAIQYENLPIDPNSDENFRACDAWKMVSATN